MFLNIVVAACLLIMTCMIHILGMAFVMHLLRREGGPVRKWFRRLRAYLIAEIVLVMFNVSILEVLLWAAAYMALGEIKDLEPAFYFSMVTFTTLGYGDIVLDERWRLLASFEAATGIIMFGWTTALVLAAVQSTYFGKKFGKPSS
jgi:Ion channel